MIRFFIFGFNWKGPLLCFYYYLSETDKGTKTRQFFASINVVELKGPQIWEIIFLNFFVVGMHFSQAVATIQSLVGSVKGVQILYSDKVGKIYIKIGN